MSVCQSCFLNRRSSLDETVETFLRDSRGSLLSWECSGLSTDAFAKMPFSKQSSGDATTDVNDVYLMLRKRLSKLRERKAAIDFRRESTENGTDTAAFLRTFLQHLVHRIRGLKKLEGSSSLQDFHVVSRCWKFIKGLLMLLGNLSDEAVTTTGLSLVNHTRSENAHVYLHAHLELLALAFIAATEIEKLFPQFVPELYNDIVWMDPAPSPATSLSSHISSFATESLTRFAAAENSKMQKSNWIQHLSCRPFPCNCFVHLLWLLRTGPASTPLTFPAVLVSVLSETIVTSRRWTTTLSPTAGDENLQSDIITMPLAPSLVDASDFALWIVSHLIDFVGENSQTEISVKNIPLEKLLAGRVLQPVLASLDSRWNESKLRYVITCLHRIQTVAGPQTECLVTLLDFFFRHMNENYSLLGSSVEGLQMIYDQPFQWMEKWTAAEIDTTTAGSSWQPHGNESSFELFLRTLMSSFRLGPDTWKRMKGRLLSKLHGKFFESLSMSGWSRIFDLALSLTGRTNDQTDFSQYFCDVVLDSALTTSAAASKTKLIWCGFLAVIAMCLHRNAEFLGLARKLTSEFDTFCRCVRSESKSSRLDVSTTSALWTVALVYIESWEGLLTAQPESLTLIGTLLSPGISDLIHAYPEEAKVSKLLTLLDDLLVAYVRKHPDWRVQLAQSSARCHATFVKSYFTHVLPSVKRLTLQRNTAYTDHIALIAVNCTAIGCFHGATGDDSPASLFQFFAVADEIAPEITASYLLQLMQKQDVLSFFGFDEAMQASIIHSWVRCVIELGDDYHDVEGLSREVAKLSDVSKYRITGAAGGPSIFYSFVVKCGTSFDQLTLYTERISLQQKLQCFFADLGKFFGSVLRYAPTPERVFNAVRIVGCILERCASALYVRAKLNSILRQTMDAVLFGTESALVTQSLQAHLPLYVTALCKLDFEGDPQVRDLLAATIRNYLPKCDSGPVEKHPLMISFRQSLLTRPRSSIFAIGVICNTFLLHITVPQNAAVAASFLVTLLPHVPRDLFIESVPVVFAGGLEAFLQPHERLRNAAKFLIGNALAAYLANPYDETRNAMASSLRQKCLAIMQSQPANTFLLLNVIADQCPVLLREILPFLAQVCSGKVPSYPMYQNAAARESYEALQRKMEQAGL
ncbi:putative Protein MMS22-like [Hypsibius exemplaris]|uniref:Protein MMS22-like n=1 Tax=Hypsibius exemplaris TaxID=2072580 RepID=A0A1W0WBS6_HYPEX|nr:putative Protein MMS22-like [Hypsibius exemplaris]